MTERTPQNAALTPQQKTQLTVTMQHLWQDAQSGQFDQSRARLRLVDPWIAHHAVRQLGVPYLEKIKTCDKARLDGRRGQDAIQGFIREELQPLIDPPSGKRHPAFAKPQKSGLRRSVSKLVTTFMLSAALATSFLHTSSMEAPPAEQAVESTEVSTTTAPVTVQNIAPLRAEFGRTTLGRELLAFADENKITIGFDTTLTDRGSHAEYNAYTKAAVVNPALTMEEQVVYLAHELRHAWQDVVLGYAEMRQRQLTPMQQWTLHRYVEADAAAYSAYFWAERQRELPNQTFAAGNASFEFAIAAVLKTEFGTDDGLTVEEFREHAMDKNFENLVTFRGYNTRHFERAIEPLTQLHQDLDKAREAIEAKEFDRADTWLQSVANLIATTPTDAEFETYLRRFGGFSIDPAAVTGLQSDTVTTQQLTTIFPAPPAKKPDGSGATIADGLANAETQYQLIRELAGELTKLNTASRDMARLQDRMAAITQTPPAPRTP